MNKLILFPALALMLLAAPASAGDWTVDNGHSNVSFRIKHFGASYFWGQFHSVTGKVQFDAAAPEKGSINLEIDANSLFTADKKRDGHLKSPDFFSVKEFPKMTFASTAIKSTGKNRMEVTGKLTLHGVTKSVTAKVEYVGTGKDPWGGTRAGFEARITIKRSDFGMKGMIPALSDEVQLIVAVEATASK